MITNEKIVAAVQFLFGIVQRSGFGESLDDQTLNAYIELFKYGVETELTTDGFKVVPVDTNGFSIEMTEKQGTVFVEVCYRDDSMPVCYSAMAHDQTKAKTVFNQVVDVLLAA